MLYLLIIPSANCSLTAAMMAGGRLILSIVVGEGARWKHTAILIPNHYSVKGARPAWW